MNTQPTSWSEAPTTQFAQLGALFKEQGFFRALRYLWYAAYERLWRWRFGVSATRAIPLSEVGIDNPLFHLHAISHYSDFKRAMKGVAVRPERDVFIDYGSGIGAAILMAATYPFRKVIGVEISPEFNVLAQELVNRNMAKLRCKNVELITSNATTYSLPDDVTVIYLFSPFRGSVLAQVFQNIHTSLERTPRDLTLIFNHPHRLADVPGFDAWWSEQQRFSCYNGFECAIFKPRLRSA